jgi:hypothetical protein
VHSGCKPLYRQGEGSSGRRVADDDKGWYLRLDDAKAKLAPPSGAQWFEREGIEIPRQIGSEEVGALIPWEPPENPLHVTTATALQILNIIDSRWKEKNPFQTRGERSLVKFMMNQHSLNRLQAKTLVGQWTDNGMIDRELYDPRRRGIGFRVKKWPGKVES